MIFLFLKELLAIFNFEKENFPKYDIKKNRNMKFKKKNNFFETWHFQNIKIENSKNFI